MPTKLHIQVIDSDSRRRASISRDLISQNMHAEVYEELDEFIRAMPREGAVMAFDDGTFSLMKLQIAMRRHGRILPIALYADQPSPPKIVQAMHDGACDYIEWPIDLRELHQTIGRLRSEGQQIAEREQHKLDAKLQIADLSRREKDILYHLANGHSNKSMAVALGISARTVEIHRANMMRKLGAQSTADAVRLAIQAGFDQDRRAVAGLSLAA